ncbi:MAG: hypothetical protein H6744_16135 [Deltaproteobacteria bacterium]|nr:hypothetical protein [Deltaproteobacteria bacterium]
MLRPILAICALSGALLGCGSTTETVFVPQACVGGATQGCLCAGGVPGAQVCRPEGGTWLACQCGVAGPDVDAAVPDIDAAAGVDVASDDPAADEATPLPTSATYRVDCLRVEALGSVGPDGFQTQFLGRAWSADITALQMNPLFEVSEPGADAGDVSVRYRTARVEGVSSLCAQPANESVTVASTLVADAGFTSPFANPTEEDPCVVQDSPGAASGDRVDVQFALNEPLYIASEDAAGVAFNCTPEPTPDAIPLRAATLSATVASDGTRLAGRVEGCILVADAQQVCSCIGKCVGASGPDDLQTDGPCAGCPVGGKPLATQLAGVQPTAHCTALAGEQAFDLALNFSATRLPAAPPTCP